MGRFLKNFILFMALFLLFNAIFTTFFPPQQNTINQNTGLIVETTKTEYNRNKTVTLKLVNNTNENLVFANDCPGEPFTVVEYVNGEWAEKTANPEISCEGLQESFEIPAGGKLEIPYTDWHYQLFSNLGRFKIQVATTVNGEAKTYDSNEFTVTEESLFGMIWMRLFYSPVYNTLVYLISVMPGFNLGLAIILLTILIRTVLLVPSHKALRAQRRMQEIQPRLEEIKKKYAGDQQRIAMETMQLWKENKVSPFGSCLPLLIQFPVLIALFYAVKAGLRPDSAFLLYEPLKDFSFSGVDTHFFGLIELTKINVYVLPLIVGGLQFIQMKLSMASRKKKGNDTTKNEMQMATNMMIYFMPVMIAVFTASLPAAVGLYWGTSTFYGIIQQFFVNKEKLPSKNSNSSDVKVKVIDKN